MEREYGLDLITSAPTVVYEVAPAKSGETRRIDNPSALPESTENRRDARAGRGGEHTDSTGVCRRSVINLCVGRRGVQKSMRFTGGQVSIDYEIPLAEVVLDFFDRLQSVSRGLRLLGLLLFDHFSAAPLVRLDILINGERVDALALDRSPRRSPDVRAGSSSAR